MNKGQPVKHKFLEADMENYKAEYERILFSWEGNLRNYEREWGQFSGKILVNMGPEFENENEEAEWQTW